MANPEYYDFSMNLLAVSDGASFSLKNLFISKVYLYQQNIVPPNILDANPSANRLVCLCSWSFVP